MSTCISQHGEYSEHDLPGTKFSEFDCNRCFAFSEDAALAEVERLRSKVTRVEALADDLTASLDPSQALPQMRTRDFLRKVESAIRAALAEPERDEESGR